MAWTFSLARQLVALTTFSDLVSDALEAHPARRDGLLGLLPMMASPLRDGGDGCDGLCRGCVESIWRLAIDQYG